MDMKDKWQDALPEEIDFWKHYIATRGGKWPDEYQMRLDPESPLQEEFILERLQEIPGKSVEILDVGAGPLTVLGKSHLDKSLNITAVDPLADEYDRILAEAGIVPPVRTVRCHGEDLLTKFGSDTFDFAYARNCLDHSYDPTLIIRNMVDLVKPERWVILRHEHNVAENAGYVGLH
ncbi:MAG: class I SAM-dependent methyltransferase, partial [Gammaproteobacteria bacterium]|nr:class I SAM-dependent methyltransferase [Gammaproteobacteria bacterium]